VCENDVVVVFEDEVERSVVVVVCFVVVDIVSSVVSSVAVGFAGDVADAHASGVVAQPPSTAVSAVVVAGGVVCRVVSGDAGADAITEATVVAAVSPPPAGVLLAAVAGCPEAPADASRVGIAGARVGACWVAPVISAAVVTSGGETVGSAEDAVDDASRAGEDGEVGKDDEDEDNHGELVAVDCGIIEVKELDDVSGE
jgi:hypothetical protein